MIEGAQQSPHELIPSDFLLVQYFLVCFSEMDLAFLFLQPLPTEQAKARSGSRVSFTADDNFSVSAAAAKVASSFRAPRLAPATPTPAQDSSPKPPAKMAGLARATPDQAAAPSAKQSASDKLSAFSQEVEAKRLEKEEQARRAAFDKDIPVRDLWCNWQITVMRSRG